MIRTIRLLSENGAGRDQFPGEQPSAVWDPTSLDRVTLEEHARSQFPSGNFQYHRLKQMVRT